VSRVIRCECGFVVRGGNDEDLALNAEHHVEEHHPDLVGRISREQLLGMAEDAEARPS
jgi:hypothetical protein